MPRRILPLTDIEIKYAKPGAKPIKAEKDDKIKKAPKPKDRKPNEDGLMKDMRDAEDLVMPEAGIACGLCISDRFEKQN